MMNGFILTFTDVNVNFKFSVEEDEPDVIQTTTAYPVNNNVIDNYNDDDDNQSLNVSNFAYQSTSKEITDSSRRKLSKTERKNFR